MSVFIRGETYPGMPEANMVGTNLFGGHNLHPLVEIELMYLPRHKFPCPYMFRSACLIQRQDSGQFPSLILVQETTELTKSKYTGTRLRELNVDYSVEVMMNKVHIKE